MGPVADRRGRPDDHTGTVDRDRRTAAEVSHAPRAAPAERVGGTLGGLKGSPQLSAELPTTIPRSLTVAGAGRYPDVEVTRSVVHDEPVSALIRHADGAQLLVVGSRGRGDLSGLLLGSVSRGVLQRAGGPVAVVRARQHTAPGS